MICVHARPSEIEKMGAPALSHLVIAQMARIEHLEFLVAKLKREQFGPKSEKLPVNEAQLTLCLSGSVIEAQPIAQTEQPEAARKSLHAPSARAALCRRICGAKSERIFLNTPSARAATESCAGWAKTRRRCSSTCRPASSSSAMCARR
jgi:hypothetical protein